MNATKYIVIGRYDCERNSWIENGDIRHCISGHNTESAAWRAAAKAHGSLGGCDGSDSLAEVMARYAKLGSRKAQKYLELADSVYPPQGAEDSYEHAGWLYVPCDFWNAHEIVPVAGPDSASSYGLLAVGLGFAVKS